MGSRGISSIRRLQCGFVLDSTPWPDFPTPPSTGRRTQPDLDDLLLHCRTGIPIPGRPAHSVSAGPDGFQLNILKCRGAVQ
ncbi:MAG: hypothetical protein Ct9H300mP14_16670 [Gammaproteobacteria bacterium]|nr:MAG: hypothetical protein Ct9H300mP14_16670 [Gammaproteobacteria bacterium]